MKRILKLKFLVFTSTILIIFIYIYFVHGFSLSVGDDFEDLRDSIKLDSSSLSDLDILGTINNIKDKFNDFQQKHITDEDNLKQRISQKFINNLTKKDSVRPVETKVLYQYDPWGIEFNYDSLMSKEINQKSQEIKFFYHDFPDDKLIIKRISLNGSFNDWLNNNYDLQNLEKKQFNNLNFWVQDFANQDSKIEEYYVNINNKIFIFRLNLSNKENEAHEASFKNVIKTFALITKD